MPPTRARILMAALALVAGGLLAVTPTATAATTAPGTFNPLTPSRILDTRNAIGVSTTTKVRSKKDVVFQVTGTGNVPSNGVAGTVVLNVTVTAPESSGNLRVYPYGGALPGTSNINFVRGQTIAGHVTVRLGTGGRIAVRNDSLGASHVIADVAGWYVAGAGGLPGTFTPLPAPVRLMTKVPINGTSTRTLAVGGSGGVPTDASAGAFNLTVSKPAATGFLTGYPGGTTRPVASNVNFVRNTDVANAATVKLGGGKLALYNGSPGAVEASVDVAGSFKAGDATTVGAFTPVTPQRLMDTRNDQLTPDGRLDNSEARALKVAGDGKAVPAGAGAVVLNVTVTKPSASGHITVYPGDATRPNASNINFVREQTIANLVTVRLPADGVVKFYNAGGSGTAPTDLIVDLAGWYVGDFPDPPARVLDLSNWKIALPVDSSGGTDGSAMHVQQPELATYQHPQWFHLNEASDGVVFRAETGGATTSGSDFPRSELREMDGAQEAEWSSTSGTHVMTIEQAITHLPELKPQVVAGQIHDGDDDVIVIELGQKVGSTWYPERLWVKAGSTNLGVLDANYALGTRFKVEVVATSAGVRVRYWKPGSDFNGSRTAEVSQLGRTGTSWYFKAGCYTQASSKTTDPAKYGTGTGEVVIYELDVRHQ